MVFDSFSTVGTTATARLVARMGSHVSRDHVSPASSVWTLWTLIRLLARMRALVCGEVIGARKYLPAHLAGVGLNARVEAHVSCQHVAARERAFANLAQVRLCGRVSGVLSAFMSRRHVFGQPIVKAEHLSAHRAHVGHI